MKAAKGIATACTFAALILPSAAGAAETIGTKLNLPVTSSLTDMDGTGERFAHHPSLEPSYFAPGGLTADTPGVVTRFRMKFMATTNSPQFRLRILSRSDADTLTAGRASQVVGAVANSTPEYPVRVPIMAGQEIGVDLMPFPVFFVSAAFFYTDGSSGSRHQTGSGGVGPLPPDTAGDYPVSSNAVMLANADIEPDADNDGYGDETQDLCSSDASTQGACPAKKTKKKKCKKRKKRRDGRDATTAKRKKKGCKRGKKKK
jgi:hypothetical protein